MESLELAPDELFATLRDSGVRVLLIGRRALNVLGSPLMTTDYDVWVDVDDVEALNQAFVARGHHPNRTAAEARARGRYVIENGERVDVLVARSVRGPDGTELSFADAWSRRQTIEYAAGLTIALPSIDDLIATKRWSMRPKDMIDIQWLTELGRGSP